MKRLLAVIVIVGTGTWFGVTAASAEPTVGVTKPIVAPTGLVGPMDITGVEVDIAFADIGLTVDVDGADVGFVGDKGGWTVAVIPGGVNVIPPPSP